MLETTDTTPRSRRRRVTIAEAARILGVSGETVRRRIHAGQLEAVREVRPQGSAWRVVLPVRQGVETTRGGHSTPHVVSHQEPGQPEHAPPVEATETTREVSSAGLVESIARLIAELAEVRVISDRRADRVAELERENGVLTAQFAAANERIVTLLASQAQPAGQEPATVVPAPTGSPVAVSARWRALAPWLPLVLVLVVLLAAGILLVILR